MCEIDNAEPNLRVLQCVDPSAGFRFSVQSRIRASKVGVSLLGPRPAWRLKSPASRSCPTRLPQRSINASLQSSLSRICAQLWPASSSNISRARRPSSARPLRLVARWLNSMRSASVSSIVLFMSTIILPFYALQPTSHPADRAFMHTDAIGDIAEHQRSQRQHPLSKEGILLSDDLGRNF